MKIPQALVVVLYMVYSVYAQDPVWKYDCRVITGAAPCGAGTCNLDDGTCTCPGDEDYNCGTTSTDPGEASCAATPCNTDGTTGCDTGTCFCKQDYVKPTGAAAPADTDCSTERTQVYCAADGADITMYPHDGSNFAGEIFLVDTADIKYPACKLTCDTGKCESSTRLLYAEGTTDTSLHDSCPETTGTTASGETTHTFKLYVQHNAGSYANTDRVFTVTCVAKEDQTFDVSITSGIVNTVPTPLTGTVTGDTDVGVTATLTTGGNTIAADTNIASGADIKLTVSLAAGVVQETGGNMKDASLRKVYAYNYDIGASSPEPSGAITVKIVEEWCVAVSFVTEFTKPTTYPDVTATFDLVLTFKAFVFPSTSGGSPIANTGAPDSTVSSATWLKVWICTGDCTSMGGSCSYGNKYPNMLTVPGGGSGRKRRQVTGSRQSEPVELLLNFTVGTSSQHSTYAAPEDISNHEDCYMTLAFILPLVMMAVLLLLALIMVYVFFTKLSHARNGGMGGETNIAYKS